MGRSRHGAQLPVAQPSYRHRGFDSLPTHQRACRRGRMEKVPVYETGGCRFDPCRRHQSTRRSSAEQSAAFRTRRSHVRIVPARRRVCSEAIRPDEEPVSKTGRGREALVGASPTASSTPSAVAAPWFGARRDGRTAKTPGPQPGGRGSTPRRGTGMPGSRAERRPAVTRKAAVRSRPWQQPLQRMLEWSSGNGEDLGAPYRGCGFARDTCAGEVLKEGRSVRTGEAAGSIPAAGPVRYSGEPRSRSSDGGAAG